MNKLTRYARRLLFWFERPLPREEWMSAFRLGEKSMEAKMKAQMPTFEPATQSPPRQQLTPLTICQKALVQRLRATLKPVDQETSPLLPAVQPINFDLVDESWLNSTPGQEDQGMETEQVPALTKLLHGGKK